MGVLKPELIMKSIIPVVMAGILGIYGMIVAVILVQKSKHILSIQILNLFQNAKVGKEKYSTHSCYSHLAAGLCCGLSSLVYF